MTKDSQIQEMQLLEQNLQNILMQKQAFNMELAESNSALQELQKAGEEVYKIVGGLMLKSDKSKVLEDLENKKKLFELRLKNLEKQEITLSEKVDLIRQEILKERK